MKAQGAVVVGGGIAGLASAIALHRVGWQVKLFERTPEFSDVGAGISLWPNSLRALEKLGVGDLVRNTRGVEATAGFRHRDGKWLFRSDFHALEQAYGETILIHRADLIDILVSALPREVLTLSAEVRDIQLTGDGVNVHHSTGSDRAHLFVAADGIHSLARGKFWGDAGSPRYAGYTTWRFVTPTLDVGREASETWGSGERVGILPFSDGRIYSYLTASVPPGGKSDNELAELKRRFSTWHDPIPALLESVTEDHVKRNDIYTVPRLKSYVHDRIALVGDAAHAMTPDLGEGGGTALEDAVELAATLHNARTIKRGLHDYDAIRRPRTQTIARQSALFGKVAQWSSPPAVAVRNTAARLVPQALFLRSLKPILDWGDGTREVGVHGGIDKQVGRASSHTGNTDERVDKGFAGARRRREPDAHALGQGEGVYELVVRAAHSFILGALA